jgi:hypothetical protein
LIVHSHIGVRSLLSYLVWTFSIFAS